jgi:hypothetical protein
MKHLWDIKFPDAPAPFSEWFPATEFTDDGKMGISRDQTFFLSNYKLPQGTSAANIQIQAFDDENKTLHTWLSAWYDDIYSESDGVLTLAEAVRPLILATLNGQREILKIETLYVYPDGALPSSGTSTSDISIISQTFCVAGRQKGTVK